VVPDAVEKSSAPAPASAVPDAVEKSAAPAPANVATHAVEKSAAAPVATTRFDFDSLLARCMGNREFVVRILHKFDAKGRSDLKALEQAVQAQDAEVIAFAAHTIKSAAANLSANFLREAAGEMELTARSGDISAAAGQLERVRQEFEALMDCVSQGNV
jgi:HPt (histidine-containing phosphotransfer) domain-containing protein